MIADRLADFDQKRSELVRQEMTGGAGEEFVGAKKKVSSQHFSLVIKFCLIHCICFRCVLEKSSEKDYRTISIWYFSVFDNRKEDMIRFNYQIEKGKD